MPLKRNTVIKWAVFTIATLLALFTIFYLPRIQRKIPEIPVDNLHIKVIKIDECVLCHSGSGDNPLPGTHAARSQCLYCHKTSE